MANKAPRKTAENPSANAPDDTYGRMHTHIWSRRTAGFLAGATLFGTLGMLGGAVASLLPPLLGALGVAGAPEAALPGLTAIASNAALFGAAAAGLGMTIGADVGANAGAAAAQLEEQERRDRSRGMAQAAPPEPRKPVRLFNWKVALATAAIFAAFGALIAVNPITAATVGLMGFKAGSAAAVVASACVMGLFGSTLGMNVPHLSHRLSEGYSSLLKGRVFEKEAAHTPARMAPPQQDAPAAAVFAPEQDAPRRSFAERESRCTLAALIEKEDRPAGTPLLR